MRMAGWRIYEGGSGVKGILFCGLYFCVHDWSSGRWKCGKPACYAGFPSLGRKSALPAFPRRVISTALNPWPFNRSPHTSSPAPKHVSLATPASCHSLIYPVRETRMSIRSRECPNQSLKVGLLTMRQYENAPELVWPDP
jgi:hypothetical protein